MPGAEDTSNSGIGSDHLLSNYAKAAKIFHAHLAIIPDGAKVVQARPR
jgi:hypothetical protein